MKNAVSFGFSEFWHKFLVFLGIESLSEMNETMQRIFVRNVVEYLQDRGCTLSSDKLTVIMNDLIKNNEMTFDQKIDELYSKVQPYGYSSSRATMYSDAIIGTKYFVTQQGKEQGKGVSLNSNSPTLNKNDVQESKTSNLLMNDETESLSRLNEESKTLSDSEKLSRFTNLNSSPDKFLNSNTPSNKVAKLKQEKKQDLSNDRTV